MARFTTRRRISAPRSRVFAVFTDFAAAADRIAGIKSLELLTDGPIGAGTRFRETREIFGKEATEEMEITVYEPDRHYRVEAESHGCKYLTTFEFEEVDGATDVTMVFEGIAESWVAKLMTPLAWMMSGATRKLIEADLDDLQKHCESTH